MNNKTFLITTALVLALAGIGSSSWGMASSDSAVYSNVLKAVTAKCGQNVRLLGILMQQGFTSYAFTSGTCGSGSPTDYVGIGYDFNKRSLTNPRIGRNSGAYDFPPNFTQPISLPDWKISSERALQICFVHGGPQNLELQNPGVDSSALLLSQNGNSLIWVCFHSNGSGYHNSSVDATTGEFLGSTSGAMPPP
jgi:hypothetical protein